VSFEGETAYWAAKRATPDDVAALEEIVREYRRLIRDESVPWPVLAALDVRFHDSIAHASHNQVRLAIMLGISRALFRASSSLEPYVDQPLRRSIGRELAGIVAAVRARDDRLARLRMRRHVKKFSDLESRIQDAGTL
jgi:DNA-binding FadR family transcriptional regulator